MNPRMEKIAKVFGLRRLVLELGRREYTRYLPHPEREQADAHYVPDSGPYFGQVHVLPKALGLVEPYPSEYIFSPKQAAPLYSGLKSIIVWEKLHQTPCGQFWTNGHMLIEGPPPAADLPARPLDVSLIKKTGLPVEINLNVVVEGSYLAGCQHFSSAYVDFIIKNIKTGAPVTFYLADDTILSIYAGAQWVAGIMPIKWLKTDAQPEPHRAPKQSKKGVLG